MRFITNTAGNRSIARCIDYGGEEVYISVQFCEPETNGLVSLD